jgi:hypothetical protein
MEATPYPRFTPDMTGITGSGIWHNPDRIASLIAAEAAPTVYRDTDYADC